MSGNESPTGRALRFEREIERIVKDNREVLNPDADDRDFIYEIRRFAERVFDEGYAAAKIDGVRHLKDNAT